MYDVVNNKYKKHVTKPYITEMPDGKREYYTVQELAVGADGQTADTLISWLQKHQFRPQMGKVLLSKLRLFISHLLDKGIEHGDMHRKNILVIEHKNLNGKVTDVDFKVIDWGLSARIDPREGHWKSYEKRFRATPMANFTAEPELFHASAKWLPNSNARKKNALTDKSRLVTLNTRKSMYNDFNKTRPVHLSMTPTSRPNNVIVLTTEALNR